MTQDNQVPLEDSRHWWSPINEQEAGDEFVKLCEELRKNSWETILHASRNIAIRFGEVVYQMGVPKDEQLPGGTAAMGPVYAAMLRRAIFMSDILEVTANFFPEIMQALAKGSIVSVASPHSEDLQHAAQRIVPNINWLRIRMKQVVETLMAKQEPNPHTSNPMLHASDTDMLQPPQNAPECPRIGNQGETGQSTV